MATKQTTTVTEITTFLFFQQFALYCFIWLSQQIPQNVLVSNG